MKYEKKFIPSEEQQQVSESQLQSSQAVHEFATPEDVLRFDARQTAVPDSVAQRLDHSVQKLPGPARPWWKRLFE